MKKLNQVLTVLALAALAVTAFAVPSAAQTGTMFVQNNAVRIEHSDPNKFTLLRLKNLGGAPQFKLENIASGISWDLSMANNNAFIISLLNSGGGEFEVRTSGRTFMRQGPTVNFDLDGNTGNLTIRGTLTQGSSREIKEDLSALDTESVLDRVAALPLVEWSYVNDSGVRHIGPVAEDFHAAFGLGADDKHLAPGDTAGVALAAIQALNRSVQEKDQRIARLEEELADLRRLVGTLAAER